MAYRSETNIIELLTRYPVRNRYDASENRLTAALTAALTRSPKLARALASEWGVAVSEPVRVRPQAPTRGERAGLIDLELRFGSSASQSVVWIEAKLHSPLSGVDQLDRYAKDLKQVPATHRLLVLLAPAAERGRHAEIAPIADRHEAGDDGVAAYFVSWQQLYASLRAHRDSHDWFTKEVLEYMTSLGLQGPARLNQARLRALELANEATASLGAIVDRAAADLHPKGWKPQDSYAYEVRYRAPAGCGWARQTRLVMGVDVPGQPQPTYYAGIIWSTGGKPFSGSHAQFERWLAKFVDWEADTYGNEEWRWQARPLRELVGLSTLEQQAEHVAQHVAETFALIEASRDPRM